MEIEFLALHKYGWKLEIVAKKSAEPTAVKMLQATIGYLAA